MCCCCHSGCAEAEATGPLDGVTLAELCAGVDVSAGQPAHAQADHVADCQGDEIDVVHAGASAGASAVVCGAMLALSVGPVDDLGGQAGSGTPCDGVAQLLRILAAMNTPQVHVVSHPLVQHKLTLMRQKEDRKSVV